MRSDRSATQETRDGESRVAAPSRDPLPGVETRAKVVEESWEQLAARLDRALDELTGMLEHLQARPPAPVRRKRERELKRWLASTIEWIETVLDLGRPQSPEEAVELIHALYHFDLDRPAVVDAFHRLLEEAGEPLPRQ